MANSKYQPPKKVQPEHQEFFTKIGSRLKAIREEKGVTITKLSEDLEISRTSIQSIEVGRTYANTLTIIRIIEYLSLDPVLFFKDLHK